MKGHPKVAVIIPTHKAERFIGDCLRSLYNSTFTDFETILVDDHSTDSTLQIVEENFPQVRTISLPKNLGFARAANVGMRATEAEYLVLLNDDTVVDPSWLEELVKCADEHPGAAMVGSKIYFPDRKTLQHAGAILYPNGQGYHLGYSEIDQGQHDVEKAVDYCTGAALLIKRELIDKVGYFYPRSRGYYDEVDMAWKARKLGYEIIYNPRAVIVHYESQTYGRSFRYYYTLNCSRLMFILLNFSFGELLDYILYEMKFFSTPYGRSMRWPMITAYFAFLPYLPLVFWDRLRYAMKSNKSLPLYRAPILKV